MNEEIICRCEEITYGEVRDAIRRGYRTIPEIGRIVRAGAGLCQGRTCEVLLRRLIEEETGMPAGEVESPTYRVPILPVPLSAIARDATFKEVKPS